MLQQSDHTPLGHFGAIDENTIFHGGGISPLAGKMFRNGPSRAKSPQSDINPVPPISLPDLRPVRKYSNIILSHLIKSN